MAQKRNTGDANARRQMADIEKEHANTLANVLDLETQILKKVQDIADEKERILLRTEQIEETQRKGRSLTDEEFESLRDVYSERTKILANTQKQLKEEEKINKSLQQRMSFLNQTIQPYFQYLMDADKAMKEMILDFGLTGDKAELVRQQIEESAIAAANLGVSVTQLTEFYKLYGQEVGRNVSLGDEQLKQMAALEKGTGLATGEAVRLAAQFEQIGMNITETYDTVQGIMETTEKMGVNTTKVLRAVGEQFKRLQTYTFRNGVSDMGEMAAYAEKFKVDLSSTLAAAEDFRSLEGAIEGAANLQILGGEFAKLADPMQMLYESRNDLEAFTNRVGEMTKGMATMVETADGFQLQLASPMARDMLKRAGDALGYNVEQMTEMALAHEKFNLMRQDMIGSSYTKEQQELIESMAQLNADTGDFYVMIGNQKRNIADLTGKELQLLEAEKATIEERAKAAQTFDDQWKIFMEQLKVTGLPLLEGLNDMMKVIQPMVKYVADLLEKIPSEVKGWLGVGGGIVLGSTVLASKVLNTLGSFKQFFGGAGGGLTSILEKSGGATGAQMMGAGKGGGALAKGQGLKALGAGAGVGAAALGAGAGIKLASEGISSLADSLDKLPEEKIEALKELATTITLFVGITAGIGALAAVAGASAGPLLAFGGAVALIGAGVGVAAYGIGQMAEGMSSFVAAIDPEQITKTALGMAGFAAAATVLGNPLSLIGMTGMVGSIATMAQYGDDMEKISGAFANMNVVLSGSKNDIKEVAEAVKTISEAEFQKGNVFQELATLLKQPLKVQYSSLLLRLMKHLVLKIELLMVVLIM
jgi:hypothetical protein